VIETHRGRPQQALVFLRRSVQLHRDNGNRGGEAEVHSDIGVALERAGRTDEAARSYQLALLLAGEAGDRFEQARAHRHLGELPGQGAERARRHLDTALGLFKGVGSPQADQVRARLQDSRPGR
jgi:tetratricopeptide (TPR) repeat protein